MDQDIAEEYASEALHELNAPFYDRMRQLLRERRIEMLLDYGSGRGAFTNRWSTNEHVPTRIDLYDPFVEPCRLKHEGDNFRSFSEVRRHHYDGVVANFVHVSIGDEELFARTFAEIESCLAGDGTFFLGSVHPCFLTEDHDGYSASLSDDWRYLDGPVPYEVQLRAASFVLRDFHRPLSHYIGTAHAAGLALKELHEVPFYEDDRSKFPSYMIYEFVRRSRLRG